MTNVFLLTATALMLASCASVGTNLNASLNTLSTINPLGTSAAKNEAPGPAAASTGLNPQQARVTDSRLLSDINTMEQVQLRLRKLNETGVVQGNYSLAKAQCWLDTALTQYHENDRTGYIEESLVESIKIVEQLERNQTAKAGLDTPLVARSTRLRSDLWSRLGKFKADEAALTCNARTVACAEVRLVRAGHAEEQTGWRSATPHLQIVEDAIRLADKEAKACATNSTLAIAAAPGSVAAQVSAAPASTVKETFVVLSDALFKFDKYGTADMLPGGVQRLNVVADRLKNYKSIESLSIVGHTDRLGSDDYNTKLSQQRADTVKAYFEKLGVKAATNNASGVGKREPIVTGCSDKLVSEALILCLQADRRVTIEVTGRIR